jgi:hypothetical protein
LSILCCAREYCRPRPHRGYSLVLGQFSCWSSICRGLLSGGSNMPGILKDLVGKLGDFTF